jgi:hypothetical protein
LTESGKLQSGGWALNPNRRSYVDQSAQSVREIGTPSPPIQHASAATVKAVQMTNRQRGLAVRRALLAIARISLEKRVLLPRHATLGAAIGTDGSNIARHLVMLQSAGDVSLVSTGRRLYVVGVRS